VTLTLENAQGAALSGTAVATSVNGVATFSGLKILKAGAGYTLKATSPGLADATSPTFTVNPGVLARMSFEVQPSNVVAGAAIAPTVSLSLFDAQDNLLTSTSGPITLVIDNNPGGATLTGGDATLSAGSATFTGLSLNKAGTGYTLKATYSAFEVTSSAFDVAPAAAAVLALTSFPTNSEVGQTLTPVQVAVRDQFGNPVNSSAAITLDGVGGLGLAFAGIPVLSGTTTVSAVNGIATFPDVSFDRYGSVAIRASAAGLTSGQANTGVTATFTSFEADSTHTCGITLSGAAFCTGKFGIGNGSAAVQSNAQLVSGGRSYKSIGTGAEHTCALTTAGVAYCWGSGGNRQIGDGGTSERLTPVAVNTTETFTAIAVGWWHACGITTGGATLCWGSNQNAQLGDGSNTDRSTPVTVGGGLTFTQIAAGRDHTCALTAVGAAYCWGGNGRGQIGDNGAASDRTAPSAVAGGLTFSSISANGLGTCALTSAGAAYCWGANDLGQVGDNSTTDRGAPAAVTGGLTFKSISTSGNHACGISSVDEVWCWGSNAQGQGENGAMGQTSTPARVGSSGQYSFSFIVAGDRHTCGVGSLNFSPPIVVRPMCWGLNDDGQLGRNSLVSPGSIGLFTHR
jgi:alpha-tubulin suppressor-like RCC1 family protein